MKKCLERKIYKGEKHNIVEVKDMNCEHRYVIASDNHSIICQQCGYRAEQKTIYVNIKGWGMYTRQPEHKNRLLEKIIYFAEKYQLLIVMCEELPGNIPFILSPYVPSLVEELTKMALEMINEVYKTES